MKQAKAYGNIAFLSTYPPRECGIATFAEDLINAIDNIGIISTQVIAISNSENCFYDNKVMYQIRQNERNDYIEMSKKLNASDIDLLVIEHEYGIYGGDHGDYILDLVNNLEIPIVTTLHTILSEPNKKQRLIINELGKKSEKIITMARNTKRMLHSIYGVESQKIEVIHHGVPLRLTQSRETLKKKFGYENRQIISTFGLIGPGKGIEYAIEAISKVISDSNTIGVKMVENRDVLYLILGQTHPALKEEGTSYRNKLEELVERLNLNKNIKFVNKYLSKDEIIQYLQLSDIYMTPYLAKDQAVSGTLAYAVGYGKAIVSTPYLYAKEMLSEGRGLLAEFSNPESLADCIKQILQDPYKKATMERNTAKVGRTMYWNMVAIQYMNVLLSIITSAPKIGVVQ
ncbi:MAG: glycosyltransferase family 4 protein [Clostridiaceae bacterium]|nr:glycosyltransferase family 4 protein [Clostridiaceae bacterium]